MNQCPSCRHDNRPEARFCTQCGMRLGASGEMASNPLADERRTASQVPPTTVEPAGGTAAGPETGMRIGGAAKTLLEGSSGAMGPPRGAGGGAQEAAGGMSPPSAPMQGRPGPFPPGVAGLGGGLRTQLHDEASHRPLAGWLVVLRSPFLPPYHDVPVFLGRNLVGRSVPEPRHSIADPSVSEQHAALVATQQVDGVTVKVVDLASANGTRVNGRRVDNAVLSRGDRLRVGKTTFVFVPVPSRNGRDARRRGDAATGA